MNNFLKSIAVVTLVFGVSALNAHNFGVVNHTPQNVNVKLQLGGIGEGIEDLGTAKGRGGVVERNFTVFPRSLLGVAKLWINDQEVRILRADKKEYDQLMKLRSDSAALQGFIRDSGVIQKEAVVRIGDRPFDIFKLDNGEFIAVTPSGL